MFSKLRKDMHLPKGCVLHSTRHTFCSNLGNRGVNPFIIQKLAGHASILQSQRYTHIDADAIEAAIKLLGAGPQ